MLDLKIKEKFVNGKFHLMFKTNNFNLLITNNNNPKLFMFLFDFKNYLFL